MDDETVSPPGYLSNEEMNAWLPKAQLLPVLMSENNERIPLSDLLRIDPASMVMELRVQSSWQAVISYRCMMQEVVVQRAERDLDRTEATLFIEFRGTLAAKGAKVPSAELVKSYVATDPRLIRAQDALFAAKEKLAAWKSAMQAMHARRECLINMGAEVRIDKKSAL